ncbi:MAG TPA: hotdog fold thioesterase [Trebonia sp.]|jgi:uncharacterized protein (TIGR00369 family)|nr:hotdog fold thioesterase [Trebonia sp.]
MIPLTVREAPQGATWGVDVLQLPGLDVLRAALERRLPDPPVTKLTGLRLSEVGLAAASTWMPATGWWQTAAGVFLAGTTAFVADMALGSSVLSSAPAGVGVTTSELSVSFLRAATIRSQTITGRGRLIHATRSLGLAEASLTDARGRLLAHASSRCVLSRTDPEILAARRLPEARASDLAEPYLREVEGDVYGQEYWDATAGLTVMRQLADGETHPPCFQFLGVRPVQASEGSMTMAMAASAWLCDGFGVVYAGAIAFLADAAITLATGTTVPPGTAFSTIDLKLYLLRTVLPIDGELMARATVAHRGRTIAIANCQITAPDGAVIAQAAGSVLILPGRHWERPVQVADEITAESSRVLTTVLFTDIVGSTRRAAELGDDRWGQVLAEHHAIVREQIRRFRGREVDTAGDGFLIAFDGAARAVWCAMAVRDHLRHIGLEVRSGIHAGECDESGGKLVGIAVHIGSRLLGLAEPGEVLVSSTVKDLVAGSGIEFDDRGEHTLRDIAGAWHLYAPRAS